MIYTSSTIEGFKVALGCLPIQASMLAVLAITISPATAPAIFWVLMASHTLSLILVLVNMLNKPSQSLYMGL